MKSKMYRIAGLIMAALALSACTTRSSHSASSPESSSLTIPEALPESQGELRLLVDGNGINAVEFSGTTDGCYWIRMNTDSSANIFYIDYKSAQRIFLSEQINSSHNDETDTSYIKDAYGGCIPIADETRLWILKFGADSLIDSLGEKALPTLYQCELNGTNRKKLFSLEGDETFSPTSGIAADAQALYLMIERRSREEMVLVRVDKETGKREDLFAMPFPDRYSILDVADGRLVLKHTFFPGTGKSPSGKQKTETQTYAIELFSPNSREWTRIKTWRPLECLCLTANGSLLVWDPTDKSLRKKPLHGTQQEELVCYIPQNNESFDGIRFVGSEFDGHVFMGVTNSEKDEYSVYGIEIATGKITPIDQNKDGTIRGIVAENENQFLVAGETQIVPVSDTLEDGTPITIESMEQSLFLVDEEAYWDGRQQGRPVSIK